MTNSAGTVRIPWANLHRVVRTLFEDRGLPAADADLIADVLVRADARGIASHGVLRLSFYLPKLDAGTIEPVTRVRKTVDLGALVALDGGNGVGQVVAAHAMDIATERAKRYGASIVSVYCSNHFGIAQYFTLRAAAQGMIGLLVSNASPAMAPYGGRERLIGNNPWSLAAPSDDGRPVVIDMANTVVARGKILVARAEGRAIPLGWALDEHGSPTTDANAALRGLVLPIAGHKGYAMSVAVDLLTGVLGGHAWLDNVHYPGNADAVGNVSHMFLAIDADRINPNYAANVRQYAQRLRESVPAIDSPGVRLPGDLEHEAEAVSLSTGVPLSADVLAVVKLFTKAVHAPLLTFLP